MMMPETSDAPAATNDAATDASPKRQFRAKRAEVNGWLVFDKPVGMTSTHAVGRLKHLFNAKKTGHAGTLDPLASGLLPIAFGEATKTVPFIQDGEKAYRFKVSWGVQTETDDTEGAAMLTSDARPDAAAIEALLPSFTGTIMQRPPAYSAIKVNGERAYDRARDGETVDLPPRPVTIHSLVMTSYTPDEAVFEARCTKGTYVRAIARDLGQALGCYGHVTALRRTRVGPMLEAHAVDLATLDAEGADPLAHLLPVEAGLWSIHHVAVNRDAAAQLRRGQHLVLLGRDAPASDMAYATCGGVPVAFGPVQEGALVPHRVFNCASEAMATDPAPPAAVATTADVLVPVAVNQLYSYRIPGDLPIAPGDLVEVPLGTRKTFGVVWATESPASGGGNLKAIAGRIDLPGLRPPLRDFVDWVARWTLMPRGMVLRMALRAVEEMGPDPVKLGFRRTGTPPRRPTPARARVLDALAEEEPQPKAALALAAQCGTGVVDALAAEGVLVAEPLDHPPAAPPPDPRHPGKTLDPVQAEAAAALRQSVSANRFGVTLLEGVTGSGKTDVYFEAVAAALEAGRQILILLPEIALTTQFLMRFTERFGVPPAEWHSAVGGRARARLRSAVAGGQAQVVVGARSSLFLPFRNLGLIVVDEEHEPAYKQDEGVTYHARDMAVVRGRLEGAAVILASATPSIETRVNAERGRYRHLRLAGRHGGRAMPVLSAVDLRVTPPARGQWIAPPLLAAMQETLARGEQSLLFLNRRGYAPLTLCRTCGHRFRCPHCAAWLVEHRFRGALVCHHCGFSQPKPASCPECLATDSLVPCGPGVERLADNVTSLFPDARTLLLSSDFLGGPVKLREELQAVTEGRVDIVIGTQLVAKGHHFPQLTLVGVIDADVGLANGDPRAAERTFQILQQVTGRAGRGEAPGRGLIQTYQPGHPVIAALLSGSTDHFYETEIEGRRAAGLPPFGRLAALIVSGTDRHAAETHARALGAAAYAVLDGLRHAGVSDEDILVLGPAEAPIAMVRGRHRFRLLVKAAREVDIQAILRDTVTKAPRPRGDVAVAIDVDPQSFL